MITGSNKTTNFEPTGSNELDGGQGASDIAKRTQHPFTIPNSLAMMIGESVSRSAKSTLSHDSVSAQQAAEEAGLHTTLAEQHELEREWIQMHGCDGWPIGLWLEGFSSSTGNAETTPDVQRNVSARGSVGRERDATRSTQATSGSTETVTATVTKAVTNPPPLWSLKAEPTMSERLRVPGRTPRMTAKETLTKPRQVCVLVLFSIGDADKGEALAKLLRVVVDRHVPPDGITCAKVIALVKL
jgi:hypothetical protein